tara:strand:+ start:52 stop:2505 length:2454 start_codon:yes stop_codon:yes gene_type:complete
MRLLILALFILSKTTFSQEVRGKIMHKNEALPFANIYVVRTSNGTFANSQGEFSIMVNSLKDTLIIRSNGYKNKKIVANKLLIDRIISLDKAYQSLDVVTVSNKQDLAKSIIKKVISSRKINNNDKNFFSANLYTKSTISKEYNNTDKIDTIKLSFTEKYSKIEYSKHKWKETKLGLKDLSVKQKPKGVYAQRWNRPTKKSLLESKTKSNLFYANLSDGDFNFYQSTITIPKLAQNPFISPTGPLALTSYNYFYSGSFYENEMLIHKIKVVPKRKEESVFSGQVQIADRTWRIVSIELDMNSKNLHKYNSFKVYQRYVLFEEKSVLDRQEFFFVQNNSGLKSTSYHGTVYSKFTNYAFQKQKIKIGNLSRETVDSAQERSSKFWETKRSIKLSIKEQDFIASADKLEKLRKANKYIKFQDSLKNKFSSIEFVLTGLDHYNTPKGLKWKIDPLFKQMRVFGIGGYRHAIGSQLIKVFPNKNELFINAIINYGFKNRDLLSSGTLKYIYLPKKFAQFTISGGSKYEMLTYMQNFSSIFSRGNFTQNNYLKAGHFFEIFNGLFFDLNIKFIQRASISGLILSDWSENLFGNDNSPELFDNYNELNLKANISYTPLQKFAVNGRKKSIIGSQWPTFILGWEQGLPNFLSSKIDYQKLLLGGEYSFKIGLLGTTKTKFWYGQYLTAKNVELPNYTFFRGTDNYFFSHPLYTFQLLGETQNSLSNYLSVNFIHHFHGAVIKKIPLLKKSKLETVTGGGLLFIKENNSQHSELYNGLEIPFKIGETQLKFGGYYAVAYSNYSNLSGMIKFGLNVFNPFTNRWAF